MNTNTHRKTHTHRQMTHSKNYMPLVAVGELHVHVVTAHEGFAVEGCVHVGGVRDGLAQHDHTG